MDTKPRSQYLYHYTTALKYLYKILKRGFWPRYSEENFQWLFGHDVYIAFPMVCFTDMPLQSAGDHGGRYGEYVVRFNKCLAKDLDVIPTLYVLEQSNFAKHIAQQLQPGARFALNEALSTPLFQFLPYLKATVGTQKGRNAQLINNSKCTLSHEGMPFDEEMEWRYVPPFSSLTWLVNDRESFVKLGDHCKSWRYRLKLMPENIDHVIVPTEAEADKVRLKFPELDGKVTTKNDILKEKD